MTVLAAAALAAVPLLSGCRQTVSSFAFTAGDRRVSLYESPARPAGEEGELIPGRDETAFFTLQTPSLVARPGTAFFLRYAGEASGADLVVRTRQVPDSERALSAGEQAEDFPSADAAGTIRVRLPETSLEPREGAPGDETDTEVTLPLREGTVVTGFQLSGGRDQAPVDIRGAGLEVPAASVVISPGLLTIEAGIDYAALDEPGRSATQSFRFGRLGAAYARDAGQVRLTLSYAYDPGLARPPEPVIVTVTGPEERKAFRLAPIPGSHSVDLYTADIGFSPQGLRVASSDPGFSLRRLDVRPFPAEALAENAPIPADFGSILLYDPRWWRQRDFELFSWNLIPGVLVFDFRDYLVQARFMSRFAFFIEKRGYAGRLLANGELLEYHGWNAHDYRPEDLAAFYQKADDERFVLNPEEYRLRDILVANGIIGRLGERWVPGHGAIIGISQSSPYFLRYLLLTHEGFHGVFFTSPEYRADCFKIWDSLSPTEQSFWRLFLSSRDYDSANPYLVVNEFQAYLMQQTLDTVSSRYNGPVVASLERAFPGEAPLLDRLRRAYPNTFHDSAERVEEAVRRAAGVEAGKLVSLVPTLP